MHVQLRSSWLELQTGHLPLEAELHRTLADRPCLTQPTDSKNDTATDAYHVHTYAQYHCVAARFPTSNDTSDVRALAYFGAVCSQLRITSLLFRACRQTIGHDLPDTHNMPVVQAMRMTRSPDDADGRC